MTSWKKGVLLTGLALSIVASVMGAYPLRANLRIVDFLAIFAGGVLFGITAVSFVRAMRRGEPKPAAAPVPKSGA